MPPKVKYSKQEIIEKAVEIISSEGLEKLTARELAAALGTSVKPIFTAFENMEVVKQCCFDYAFEKYHSYFPKEMDDNLFLIIGKTYIQFAKNEPELYQVVFMQSQSKTISFSEYMEKLDDDYSGTINFAMEHLGLSAEKVEKMYMHMWIYCTGIASLCATKQCDFSDEEIERMLNETINGYMETIKC